MFTSKKKSDVIFTKYSTVSLVEASASDERVVRAAKVSTKGEAAEQMEVTDTERFISFLMEGRHGSPFEHNLFTFLIDAPIFVWREFMRHRIGFSYNETSARYKEMAPRFFISPRERPLQQVGKPGEYTFTSGTPKQYKAYEATAKRAATAAWHEYQYLLEQGVAREVARQVLPVNIMSQAYVTCNARSLMSFLSLRTTSDTAMFPSFPMWEIETVALQMEMHLRYRMPATHAAYEAHGRVAP